MNFSSQAGGVGQFAVTGDQAGVEQFSQGDIRGIVGREVVAVVPDQG